MPGKLINPWIASLMVFAGFAFLACGDSSTPSKPYELTEDQKKAKDGREALESKTAEYTTIPAKAQLAKEPYRNKRLIFFRQAKDRWVMNDFGFDPDASGSKESVEANSKLRFKLAEKPDEVGTIALLPQCKEVGAGTYVVGSGSIPAYKERCELILIDAELSSVVYRKVFEGELDTIKTLYNAEKSVTAKIDRMDIVNFLDRLERKAEAKSDQK